MTFTLPLLILCLLSAAAAGASQESPSRLRLPTSDTTCEDFDDTFAFLQTTLSQDHGSSLQSVSSSGNMFKTLQRPRDLERWWTGSWSDKLFYKVKEIYHFHFQKPDYGDLCREIYMVPCLVLCIVIAPNFVFFGIAVVQFITHLILLCSNFHCDVWAWCNLTALVFGIFYLALGVYSLMQQKDEEDLDKNQAGHFQMDLRVGYFRSRIVAGFICFVGLYIITSHTIAVITGGENPIL